MINIILKKYHIIFNSWLCQIFKKKLILIILYSLSYLLQENVFFFQKMIKILCYV